jgi:integrase
MKRERLSDTTQHQYMDTLGHMLQRAVSEGRIVKNWVREKIDLPTAASSSTELLELGECALLLEAARRLYPPDKRGRPIYPLLAFMLFTGCIESERAGIELCDIRLPGDPVFPGGVVIIRPNASRDRLKTIHRERMIPIQPQLAEILVEYLNGPNAPRGPLLFPDSRRNGAVPVGDWRKTLDQIAQVAGFPRGKVRTRRFRVAFATHRLCTLDERGLPMTAWDLRGEMGHGTEQMIEQRYGRYAKFRGRQSVLEFRWEHWKDRCGDVLALGLARLLKRSQHRSLAVLAEHRLGLSLVDWQRLRESNPGTFFPHRDRLVQLGLVTTHEDGTGIRRYVATEDGDAVVRAYAADPAASR